MPAELEPEAKATVRCAEQNYEFLKPLMKRLKARDGSVGMHTVPHIMAQTLELLNISLTLTPALFLFLYVCVTSEVFAATHVHCHNISGSRSFI